MTDQTSEALGFSGGQMTGQTTTSEPWFLHFDYFTSTPNDAQHGVFAGDPARTNISQIFHLDARTLKGALRKARTLIRREDLWGTATLYHGDTLIKEGDCHDWGVKRWS